MTGAGEEPMCGVIEKIRLVNFMNHECAALGCVCVRLITQEL